MPFKTNVSEKIKKKKKIVEEKEKRNQAKPK